VLCPVSFTLIRRWLLLRVSVTYFCMLLPFLHLPPCLSVKSFVPENPESLLKIVFSSAKTSSAL
jgi:hypothetical protein